MPSKTDTITTTTSKCDIFLTKKCQRKKSWLVLKGQGNLKITGLDLTHYVILPFQNITKDGSTDNHNLQQKR